MFERYGGFSSVRRIVSAYYDAVMDTPHLARHFAGVDMKGLIEHQTQFISYLMDGPGSGHSDEVLRRVHARLGITKDEFDDMADLLADTLEDQGLEDEDIRMVEHRFRNREALIVRPAATDHDAV